MLKIKTNYFLYFAFLLLFIPLLGVGIYPDEIAIQLWSTRFWEDYPSRSGVWPQCLDTFHAKIPSLLYLPAFLLSLISWIHDTRIFRIFTIAIIIVTILVIHNGFLKAYEKNSNKIFLIYIFIVLSGTKLFVLLLFRPEVYAVLLIIYGYCLVSKNNSRFSEKIIFLLLYLCVIYMHPFGIYFLPAVILVLYKNYFQLLFAIWLSIISYKLWDYQLFKCSDQKVIELHSSFNISPLAFFESPTNFSRNIFENLFWVNIQKIIKPMLISNDNIQSAAFFPRFDISNNYLFQFSNLITALFFVISFIWSVFFIIKNIYLIKSSTNIDKYCALILVGVLVHLLLNRTYAFYAANFWYIVLTLIFALNLKRLQTVSIKRYILIFAVTFGLVINYSILLNTYNYDGPNLSLGDSSYYTKEYRQLVLKKFHQCCSSIEKDKFQIDDASYFILKKSIKYPVPITYNSVFGTRDEVNNIRGMKYSIATCNRHKAIYGNKIGTEIDGGYKGNNICFLPLSSD